MSQKYSRYLQSISFILAVLLLAGCAQKEPEPAAQAPAAQPAQQAAQPAPQPQAPSKEAVPAPAKEPAAPAPAAKAPAAAPSQSSASAPAPIAETKPPASAPPPAEKAAPVKPEEPKPQPVEKPAAPSARTVPKDKEVIVLKATLGGVRFQHKKHAETQRIPCETCHHSSRPEKPAAAPQQACHMCHTPVIALPMKTRLQGAFHNPTATSGTCIDCHKAEAAKGKATPAKCLDCHKKENS